MNLTKSLLNFLKKKDTDEAQTAPEGICPNCWGRQEYGGQFYEKIKQENLDINSKESNVGWVSAYANKHLNGIALKRTGNGNKLICDKCNVSYQPSENHIDE